MTLRLHPSLAQHTRGKPQSQGEVVRYCNTHKHPMMLNFLSGSAFKETRPSPEFVSTEHLFRNLPSCESPCPADCQIEKSFMEKPVLEFCLLFYQLPDCISQSGTVSPGLAAANRHCSRSATPTLTNRPIRSSDEPTLWSGSSTLPSTSSQPTGKIGDCISDWIGWKGSNGFIYRSFR